MPSFTFKSVPNFVLFSLLQVRISLYFLPNNSDWVANFDGFLGCWYRRVKQLSVYSTATYTEKSLKGIAALLVCCLICYNIISSLGFCLHKFIYVTYIIWKVQAFHVIIHSNSIFTFCFNLVYEEISVSVVEVTTLLDLNLIQKFRHFRVQFVYELNSSNFERQFSCMSDSHPEISLK